MGGPRGGGRGRLSSLAKDERPSATWPTVRRLAAYLTPQRAVIASGMVWVIASAAAGAATPAVTGWIVNVAVSTKDVRQLGLPFAVLVGVAVVGWLTQRQQILMLGAVGQGALLDVRAQVFGKVQDLSVAFFERAESGDLMSTLINDVDTINSFLSTGFRRLLGSGFGVLAMLIAMVWVDWRLALATLVVVPLMFATSRLFGWIARRAFRRRQETLGDISSTLAEELGGIKVAQAFGRTDRNRTEFEVRNAENRDASVTASAVSSAFSPVLGVISAISLAIVAGVGGLLAARGLITIGVVVAFFGFSRQFFNAVSQVSSLYADTQAALAGGERIFTLLDTPVEVADKPGALELGRIEGRVRYSGVCFSYGDGPRVLHDIALDVEPGTTLAMVGPTGPANPRS